MKLLGFNGPPRRNSSIDLNRLAAFDGISEPVYTCMVISWTVLKQPQRVVAGKPTRPLKTIVVAATPLLLSEVFSTCTTVSILAV